MLQAAVVDPLDGGLVLVDGDHDRVAAAHGVGGAEVCQGGGIGCADQLADPKALGGHGCRLWSAPGPPAAGGAKRGSNRISSRSSQLVAWVRAPGRRAR